MEIMLFCIQAEAASLSDIKISNSSSRACITFIVMNDSKYAFSKINKHSAALYIKQMGIIQGLPLQFSGKNLVKSIRYNKSKGIQSLHLIVELTKNSQIHVVKQRHGSSYSVSFIIKEDHLRHNRSVKKKEDHLRHNRSVKKNNKVIIAVDAGHGGQDPGAIGPRGTCEKNITIAIARKLYRLLNNTPMFKAVMTRDCDHFISVIGRSDVAREQNASFLVSIHADAAPTPSATGASVWILSNQRANSEMANWLEEHEKQSWLLGGVGDVLATRRSDPYFSQAVLDLQFCHSQRVGYGVAKNVLIQLGGIGLLHKCNPEHASLGVLRAPDIPSILVETGFISNYSEERLLANARHQQQIAFAIYKGLCAWFEKHPLKSSLHSRMRKTVNSGLSGNRVILTS